MKQQTCMQNVNVNVNVALDIGLRDSCFQSLGLIGFLLCAPSAAISVETLLSACTVQSPERTSYAINHATLSIMYKQSGRVDAFK